MSNKFKSVVLFLNILVTLVISRSYGCIIHDIARKYKDINVSDLRKLEKLHIKRNKSQLGINFLINCKTFGIFPKFIYVNIRNIDEYDTLCLKKKLRNNAIHKRIRERNDFDKKIRNIETTIRSKLNTIDWLIIKKLLVRNIKKSEQSIVTTHEKKLRNLTKNRSNPFTHEEVVKNISSKNLALEELNILKFGLNHSLPPLKLRKTNVFVSFEMIHRFLREDLKNNTDKPVLKAQLSHLANSYIHNYQPSRSTLTKHRILKKLRNDKEIVILRPDKGSGVVVLNLRDYEKSIKNLINDKTKFKELSEDVTIKRESKLQRFLRTLKNNNYLDDVEYEKIYPSGSCPAKIYGSPKMHKPFDSNSFPNFRPIVSSIGTYNYNLSKYLCELLSPNLPNEFCTKDMFTFVEELKEVSINDKFLVSYDVNSLFTNISLKETIKLAVDLIKTSYPNLKISTDNLTQPLKFATCETHFLFNGTFYDQ